MSNVYTGRRYVPLVLGTDEPHDKTKPYEALTIVCDQGASYTSRKDVPVGIEITNGDYWTCTGNYDAQVENYRTETQNAVANVNYKLDSFENTQDGKFSIMMEDYKSQINAYADGKYVDIDNQVTETNLNLETSKNEINASMTSFENQIQDTVDNYTTTVNNQIVQVESLISSIDIIYDAGTSTDTADPQETIIEGGVV